MNKYSGFSIVANALRGQQKWKPALRKARISNHYDVLIIGAGGHGLATAYYLKRHHGIDKVAVIEKNHIGSGNSGRNTQVCRSNYFYPESGAFYEHSLRMYENLGLKINYNIMFSQRGNLELSHSHEELEISRRWANAMRLNGIDSELLTPQQIRQEVPILNLDCRYPVRGGSVQRRAGISRHDAVVWGYARAATEAGVDIIPSCEVTDFEMSNGEIDAVMTTKGRIGANRFALCVAGHSSVLAAKAGLKLPIESVALQALVTEPVKPILNTVVGSAIIHCYVSQSDRGEIVIGGGTDGYHSYAQRGSLPTLKNNAAAIVELFPSFSRLRVMRQWAGICDLSPDASPIVGKTSIKNLYISTGWGTGGYKAIPAGGETLAETIATDKVHELLKPFRLGRFHQGSLIDEAAAAGVAH